MTKAAQRFGLGLSAAVIALGLSAGVYASTQNTAQGPGPFRGRRPLLARLAAGARVAPLGKLASRLGVTDAQKAQIKAVMQSHREERQGFATRAADARAALRAAMTADPPDEAAIRQRSAELAAVQADMAVARARVRAEVLQQLTPEQRAQAKTLQSQMKDRISKLRQRVQQRRRGPGDQAR
jgi:Spy/CpxP family protein refolding chaperone